MLKALIVDDELECRDILRILLQDFCAGVEVTASCKNVSEAIDAIQLHQPDIVFLDIQMQRENGFDLLSKLKSIDFEIIFTTAHAEYALKAFSVSAIHYLLKPIDVDELKQALDRVKKKMSGNIALRLEKLSYNLKPTTSPQLQQIGLPTTHGLTFVKIEQILYCEAANNYTQIYTDDGKKHLVTRTLKEYEGILEAYNFFRIHHSYVINLNCVKDYVKGEGGYVIMKNNTALDVSKRKKESFLARLGH
jgi:two-component system LytT family response regulator